MSLHSEDAGIHFYIKDKEDELLILNLTSLLQGARKSEGIRPCILKLETKNFVICMHYIASGKEKKLNLNLKLCNH